MLLATKPRGPSTLPCRPQGDETGPGEEVTGALLIPVAEANAAAASHLQEASAMEQATSQPHQLPQCMEPRPLGQGWGQGGTVTGKASQHHMPQDNLPALHTQAGGTAGAGGQPLPPL